MEESASRFLPGALRIGIESIDEQHARLFGQLVEIKQICLVENALPPAEANALVVALSEHYSYEMALARQMGIEFTDHAKKHGKMLRLVDKALCEAVAARADAFSTLRYIEYWFERHIAEDDRLLGAVAASRIADAGELFLAR